MASIKFAEIFRCIIVLLSFVIISNHIFKRSKFKFFLFEFVTIFSFLLKKFIQLNMLPISMDFVLNQTLAGYNDYLCDSYSELFKRLGREFNVQYDRSKHWKVQELRDLVNEAYSLYSALFLSVYFYKNQLSPEGSNFYKHLLKLMVVFSNACLKPSNLTLGNLVNIDIYNDFFNYDSSSSNRGSLRKLTDEPAPGTISFLSLVHSENALYVSDQHITQALMDFHDIDFFEKTVSLSNTLYNITTVLKRESLREQRRGLLSHLFVKPNFMFANLHFLRSLMMYKFKGVRNMVEVRDLKPATIDTLLIPDRDTVTKLELQRHKLEAPFTNKTEFKDLMSILYGSDVYLKVLESYRSLRRIVVLANPNGVCYEFHVMNHPMDVMIHIDNGRSTLFFNYPSVGYSKGKPTMSQLTKKCNYLIKYLDRHFSDRPSFSLANKLGIDKTKSLDPKMTPTFSFHAASLGGFFITRMMKSLEAKGDREFMIYHKTIGDLRRMSTHIASNAVGPFLRFFGLDYNCAQDFVKLNVDKIIIVDIADEVIPLSCSLAHTAAKTQLIAGVGKLSNSFMDYKYKTLQLLNDHISSTNRFGSIDTAHTHSTSASSNPEADSKRSSLDSLVPRIKLIKELLSTFGKNINSSGQNLINLLESESDNSLKNDLMVTSEYFTRLMVYGSLPLNCMPNAKVNYNTLVHLYELLQKLDLNANYFTLHSDETYSGSGPNSDKTDAAKKRGSVIDDAKLVKIPPKVAVYFSILLDEVDVYVRGDTIHQTADSDVCSINSNNSEGAYLKKRVVFKDGDYYMDFASIGDKKLPNSHILEHFKNDLRNFGLSASKYRLLPIKMLSYLRLYSLFNALNSLSLATDLFNRFNNTHPLKNDLDGGNDQLQVLYTLAKKFIFNLVQVFIEEPFMENKTDIGAGSRDNQKLFQEYLEKFKSEYKKFGLALPQFTGHLLTNSHQDNVLLNYLIRNL